MALRLPAARPARCRPPAGVAHEEDGRCFAELRRRGEVTPGRGVGHGIGVRGVVGAAFAGVHEQEDSTLGCIALDDDEIDEIVAAHARPRQDRHHRVNGRC
ncbi:hypothetical protein [Sorangium sp. So ce131]|uniref:hypothetical protein n=1 Tax=Sorangium sp. So ce131 TaxID=3133282 RepID=UPI003F5EE1D8